MSPHHAILQPYIITLNHPLLRNKDDSTQGHLCDVLKGLYLYRLKRTRKGEKDRRLAETSSRLGEQQNYLYGWLNLSPPASPFVKRNTPHFSLTWNVKKAFKAALINPSLGTNRIKREKYWILSSRLHILTRYNADKMKSQPKGQGRRVLLKKLAQWKNIQKNPSKFPAQYNISQGPAVG